MTATAEPTSNQVVRNFMIACMEMRPQHPNPKPAWRRGRRANYHPTVVAMLRKHRVAQLEERLAAANQWTDTGLVFTTAHGTPLEPRDMLRAIEAAAEKVKAPGTGVHMLRHSAAVTLMENKVHIKAVADILGHASIATTGDIAHLRHRSTRRDDRARRGARVMSQKLVLSFCVVMRVLRSCGYAAACYAT